MDKREAYWINYYDTYSGNGYNAAPGGEGASHPVKLSYKDVIEIYRLLRENKYTIKFIASMFGVSTKTISDINLGKSRVGLEENIQYPIRNDPYGGMNLQKDELFNSLVESNGNRSYVANKYGCTPGSIWHYCKKYGIPTNKEYYKHYISGLHYCPQCHAVYQIDKDTGDIICSYKSIREAARQMGCYYNAIKKALDNPNRTSCGYRWKSW